MHSSSSSTHRAEGINVLWLFPVIVPFINQSFEFLWGVTSYLVLFPLAIWMFFLIVRRISFTQIDVLNLTLALSLILVIGSAFYDSGATAALAISLFYLFFFAAGCCIRGGGVINVPVNFFVVIMFFVFLLEMNGFARNFQYSSRGAVEGSILGLSVFFGLGAILSATKLQTLKKKKVHLVVCAACVLIVALLLKSKGPLLGALICIGVIFFIRRQYTALFFGGISAVAAVGTLLMVRMDDNSLEHRIEIYTRMLRSFEEVSWIPLTNLKHFGDTLFHNWIFESLLMLGWWGVFCILIITICLLGDRMRSLNSIVALYILIVGLFSFELDNIFFAAGAPLLARLSGWKVSLAKL